MGKSLKGEEIGKGISQRKDGLYHARFIKRVLTESETELLLDNSKDGRLYPFFVVA